MNSEFIQGKIMLTPQASNLAEEYETLVWQTDNGVIKEPRKEHSSLANHLTDAALYLWRHCYSYLFAEPVQPVKWGSQEDWEPKHKARLEEQIRRQQNPNSLDLSHEDTEEMFDFSLDEPI